MGHIDMHKPLQGKVALITGAGRGIGQALALAYANAGAAVCCAARSMAEVQATARAIEEAGGTTVMPPGWSIEVHESGALIGSASALAGAA